MPPVEVEGAVKQLISPKIFCHRLENYIFKAFKKTVKSNTHSTIVFSMLEKYLLCPNT